MGDIWFRGESVSVKPAKVGGVVNDIGDGMYLTDQLEVANQYAQERSSHPDDRRVYSVKADRSGMRVLDLTTDSRWRNMMDMPIPSQPGETFETMLKKQPASQQYNNAFKSFISNNKINLDNFDAVIGYEYRSGGKQMCILYKGGQASPWQAKLRLQFIPVGALTPTPKSPRGLLQFNGKIGPGLKVVGGSIAFIAIQFLLQWLLGKVIEKMQEESLKRQMENLRPTIETAIRREKQIALNFCVDGKTAFATIRISLEYQEWYDPGQGGYYPTSPSLQYESMNITDNDETTPKDQNDGTEDHRFVAPGAMSNRTFYKMSLPLTFSRQEVDLYRAYLKEIEWYDAQVKVAPSSQDVMRLNRERDKLVEQLNAALAD